MISLKNIFIIIKSIFCDEFSNKYKSFFYIFIAQIIFLFITLFFSRVPTYGGTFYQSVYFSMILLVLYIYSMVVPVFLLETDYILTYYRKKFAEFYYYKPIEIIFGIFINQVIIFIVILFPVFVIAFDKLTINEISNLIYSIDQPENLKYLFDKILKIEINTIILYFLIFPCFIVNYLLYSFCCNIINRKIIYINAVLFLVFLIINSAFIVLQMFLSVITLVISLRNVDKLNRYCKNNIHEKEKYLIIDYPYFSKSIFSILVLIMLIWANVFIASFIIFKLQAEFIYIYDVLKYLMFFLQILLSLKIFFLFWRKYDELIKYYKKTIK